jgi:hypothetical protein
VAQHLHMNTLRLSLFLGDWDFQLLRTGRCTLSEVQSLETRIGDIA